MPQCPVACGQCCELWRDVFTGDDFAEMPECPYTGDNCCQLRYEDRPLGCQEHECSLAIAVRDKLVNLEEAAKICEECATEAPEQWETIIGRKVRVQNTNA